MLKFGIWTHQQYLQQDPDDRPRCAARVSYALLDVGLDPSPELVRAFEDISFHLRTTNGTFRTTFRNRFPDVNAATLAFMKRFWPSDAPLRVQDRASSHGLTTWEWAQPLLAAFPHAELEASDLLHYLVLLSLDNGMSYVVEPNGKPLQYIRPPFVVWTHHPGPRRWPFNQWLADRARTRFHRLKLPSGWITSSGGPGFTVKKIPIIHPEALRFSETHPGLRFRERSVFDPTPGECDVIRTMNILNLSYFPEGQLVAGARAVYDSLRPGGLWIVGRTLEEDNSNHATFFRRQPDGWEVLGRIGKGSEIEHLALGAPLGSPA